MAVIGGYNFGAQTPFVAYSSVDGATWTQVGSFTPIISQTVSETISMSGLRYFNGTFYATLDVSTGIPVVHTTRSYQSTDNGATWAVTPSNLGMSTIHAVNNTFVRLSGAGFELSTDSGVTWNAIALNPSANLGGFPASGGLLGTTATHFVAYQNEKDATNSFKRIFYTSPDGSIWTAIAQDSNTQSIQTDCLQSNSPLYGQSDGSRIYVAGNSCVVSTDGSAWRWEFYDAGNAASASGYKLLGFGLAGAITNPFIMTYPSGVGTYGANQLSTIP